jgi:methylmalonyl-CoA mutase N-terminal domain/subunit
MEDKIRAAMAEVDEKGGIVQAIAEGHVQAAVSRQAYEHLKKLERGDIRKVGVNCYRTEEEEPDVAFHPFKEEDAEKQIERLNRVRVERDAQKVDQALAELFEDAEAGTNVMPAVMNAVKVYATLGEITDCLVDVYGRYKEPIRF